MLPYGCGKVFVFDGITLVARYRFKIAHEGLEQRNELIR
jgi:hypothetical protein